MENLLIWSGIVFCLSQSAIFSGLNLAFFSLTRLRLEIEAEAEDSERAAKILAMREDSNFLLTTILWGNVGINVLLTLLTESVMAGALSFLFSTVLITVFGEILPQAYFSRHALRMASLMSPVLKFYQFLLYPVAKPCAVMLDRWLGKESAQFFKEQNIKLFLQKHIEHRDSDIEHTEGTGAINFLSLDDQLMWQEGEVINPESIIELDTIDRVLVFPKFVAERDDPFIQQINKSGEKWVIFTNQHQQPLVVLDADGFLRSDVMGKNQLGIHSFCFEPTVVANEHAKLASIIKKIRNNMDADSDAPIDVDVVLLWADKHKRIITGADLLGRLLKGV